MYSADTETLLQLLQVHRRTGILSTNLPVGTVGTKEQCCAVIDAVGGKVVACRIEERNGRQWLVGREALQELRRLGILDWTLTLTWQQPISTTLKASPIIRISPPLREASPVTTPPERVIPLVTTQPLREASPVTTPPERAISLMSTQPLNEASPVTISSVRAIPLVTLLPPRDILPVTALPSRSKPLVTTPPLRDRLPVTTQPLRAVSLVTTPPLRDTLPVTTQPLRAMPPAVIPPPIAPGDTFVPVRRVYVEAVEMTTWLRTHRMVYAMINGRNTVKRIAELLSMQTAKLERVLSDLQAMNIISLKW